MSLFTCELRAAAAAACQALQTDPTNGFVTAAIVDLDSHQLCDS